MNIGETTVNLLLMQGGSTGAMRACELYRYCLFYVELLSKNYKISQKDSGAVVPPPTPKSSHIMSQSVFIPLETKLGYFSRLFLCFLPWEVQGSATQVSLIVNLLTEK